MSNELLLGQRAATCRHFYWMPGMRTYDGCYVVGVHESMLLLFNPLFPFEVKWQNAEHYVPDVFDAATKGCLLEMVRAAWRDGSITPADLECLKADVWIYALQPDPNETALMFPPERHGVKWFDASTEAEAMIRALEEAPCRVG